MSRSNQAPHVPWTEFELEKLRRLYSCAGGGPLRLDRLAAELGRGKANVCRKAAELGLTNRRRAKNAQLALPKYGSSKPGDPERRAAMSRRVRAHFAKQGHPRGMLGKKHTHGVLAKLSAASRRAWSDPMSGLNSEESRARRARQSSKLWSSRARSENTFSRCRRGARADLGGVWFRSAWEANYARFLNREKAAGRVLAWEFEPVVFRIDEGSSYTPDFRVWLPGWVHEWHEVKGWLTAKGAAKLEGMARVYPLELVRVIGPAWFKAARKSGLSTELEGWEKS